MQRLLVLIFWAVIGSSVIHAQTAGAIPIGPGQELELTNALHKGLPVLLTGKLTLSQPLVITNPVSIQGVATASAILSGNNKHRLFVILPGGSLTLHNLTLIDGRQTATNTENGGIPLTAGGAIFNDRGTLRITSCTLSNHTVLGAQGATGVYNFKPYPGQKGGAAFGGAIYNNEGFVQVASSMVFGNSVLAGSGGPGADGQDVGLGQSGADGGDSGWASGGAIYSKGGALSITNSTLERNAVYGALGGKQGAGAGLLGFSARPGSVNPAAGGAVYADGITNFSITKTLFVGNSVTNAPGRMGAAVQSEKPGAVGSPGGSSFGGAIYSNTRLLLTETKFDSNVAGGGPGGIGSAAGSSLFNLIGGAGGRGGEALGGAIYSGGQGVVVVEKSLFVTNSVYGGEGGTGGAGNTPLAKIGLVGSRGLASGGTLANQGGAFSLMDANVGDSSSENLFGTFQIIPSPSGFIFSMTKSDGFLTFSAPAQYVGAEVQMTTNLGTGSQWITLEGRATLTNSAAFFRIPSPSPTNLTHVFRLKI